jgi:hypothetical protein
VTSLQKGSVFQVDGQNSSRLWLVLTDVGDVGEIVIAPIEESKPGTDTACIIRPGDHPLVSRTSCVDYARARLSPIDALRQAETQRRLFIREPASPELLERAIEGGRISRNTKSSVLGALLF